jgi:hypothetical protein
MCGDCWNAAMGAPAAVVAARFAWIGYKDRIPFVGRRDDAPSAPADEVEPDAVPAGEVEPEPDLVDAGSSPP